MRNNKSTIGKTLYILAIILLFASFLLIVLEKTQVVNLYTKPVVQSQTARPVNDIDYSPATPTDNEDIDTKKASGDLTNQNTTPTKPGEPINVILTAATQDTPGGPVVVRVLLTDVKSGNCAITISKDSVNKEYSKKVVNAGTYYNCEALDIPVSELNNGVWSLNVTVSGEDRTGSATQEVEVKL